MRQAKNRINRIRWPKEQASLSPKDMHDLWNECRGCCSVTGLAFTNDQYGQGAAKRASLHRWIGLTPRGHIGGTIAASSW